MAISYRHGISILELIFYTPAIFVALLLAFRHGFRKSSGWYYFIIFSLARIVGSCCYLATISYPTSTDLYIAYAVCSSVGVGPLLHANTGLLSRINDSIDRKTNRPLNPLIFRGLLFLTLAALIVGIVGQTTGGSSAATLAHPKIETKIGIILFVVIWVAICFILLALRGRYNDIEDGEHRLLAAVGMSLPFILVRLIYSVLSVFVHNSDFNMITGNVTIMLVMAVLEEFAVVVICLGIGLTLQVRQSVADPEQPQTGYPADQGYRNQREGKGPRSSEPRYQPTPADPYEAEMSYLPKQPRRHRRRGGPITQLVRLAADEIQDRRYG
ncbi:hypothetical protein DTO166G4_6917 [Paecilomyces variotii]|uniref:DUF7702 domain-containing protein n=1 Tax=Byssochlamys spectabilis TaxID=264951 RepID=A0A443HY20_BYSSP|nr:hypothetical protein C8Q69DRAFT_526530 [Paecilomyces variotii]KAJ9211496.1 hypothetical protein DTO166G4_6917 [Paecilomyces variotii]KAJ9232092.1 hypothetical protein DTO166G5_6420 [Paecilomyces variotii]KAJ9249543.1 hypothetical protein DTO207G8_6675 [Paecilomyces variotii]KAJ9301117.1 hypothetical protein DTO217A2_7688 [Paecilomyces variotii]KAJ9354876.1 hypothetical protein DTO280E4_6660 [Paecilomyces variotii]